ncbi:hypothetical protein [Vibrio sp.]|uniref:hypothetical protein n=1 Tax=Vibrio sp. TaxID=678 RepID=UPI003D0A9250
MFNLATIRALKGAPLSILVAMLIARQPVGENWLVTITGYSQNTVRNGCKFLTEIQMIQRNGRYHGYVLTQDAKQLTLGQQELGEGQNLTLPESTTTITLNKKEDNDSEEKAAEEEARASKNDSRLVLLYSAGIMEPTASRLLEKNWVTKEYLEAHIDKANKERTSVGLLIHRIRSHDPIPKVRNDQDPDSYRRSWLGVE